MVSTGSGNDEIFGFDGSDTLDGGAGDDFLHGERQADFLTGGEGNDRLQGGPDSDGLDGGAGNDLLIGGAAEDVMVGGLGDDTYRIGRELDIVEEEADEGVDIVKSAIDYTLGANVEHLSLSAGARVGTGNDLGNAIFGSGGADTLSGLAGADILRGRNARDTLDGGDGDDLIDGGAGKDTLTGGAGRDLFQFRDGDMTGTRMLADLITDFSQADGEKILLREIDAREDLGQDQDFAFIGTGAFSGTAGELRYEVDESNTWIEADTDGDSQADWVIGLTGAVNLTESDFLL